MMDIKQGCGHNVDLSGKLPHIELLPHLKLPHADPLAAKLPQHDQMCPPKNVFQRGLLAQAIFAKPIFKYLEQLIFENGILHKLEKTVKYLAQKPLIAMPIFAALLSLLTPVLIFVFFALVTASITFSGFLLAEGAILGMGGIIVACFLIASFSICLTLGTAFSVVYVGLQKLRIIK